MPHPQNVTHQSKVETRAQIEKDVRQTLEAMRLGLSKNHTEHHNKTKKAGLLHLNKTEMFLANKEPEKVGLSSKNPFSDFSAFEKELDRMQPVLPEKDAQVLAKSLIDKLKTGIQNHTLQAKQKPDAAVTSQLKSLTQQVEQRPDIKVDQIDYGFQPQTWTPPQDLPQSPYPPPPA